MWSPVEPVTASPRVPFPWRMAALGSVSCTLYLVGTVWQPPLALAERPLYLFWFSGVFLVYVAALLDTRRHARQPHPALLPLIAGWAVVFRLTLLWVTPGFLSDDIYRYIWDGLVQQTGINPYLYPPEAPELAFLRDDTVFPMINRKSALTLYPPGAQLFFRLMAWIGPGSLVAMKASILLADVVSIVLLLHLFRRLGRSQAYVVLYAWHPLVIVELGISGHLDGLMIPFVLLAVLWTIQNRPGLVGAALATAALIKLYPALLLPALYRKRGWPMPVVCLAVLALGYLLYLGAGYQVIGYLPQYISPYEFYNLSLRHVLMWLVGLFVPDPFPFVKGLSTAIMLLVMLQCVRHTEKSLPETLQWSVGLIVLYLLLVSPSVFQWYLVWLLALVTLTPSGLTPAWLYWSWSVNLGYLGTLPLSADILYWLYLVEYVPVFLWIVGYAWWVRSKKSRTAPRSVADVTS
jgi:alpha-1,6-mannosyltransferase